MSRHVFILGAGASKEAGAPTMPEFLDVARDLHEAGQSNPYGREFDLVFQALRELQIVHHKSTIDLENIESVFAAFEMAALIGRLGTMAVESVKELPLAMERLISTTLGCTLRFSVSSTRMRLDPVPVYGSFADLVHKLARRDGKQFVSGVSVLTLNYDPCVDDALAASGVDFNYCIDGQSEHYDCLSLLKLHGSLNWARCSNCDRVVSWDFGKRVAQSQFSPDQLSDMGDRGFPLGKLLDGSFPYSCGHTGPCVPFLVPPTYSKGTQYNAIAPVWQTAAKHLCEAENIFIVGFSLPETDRFFRYFYALGTIGVAKVKRFWVFDPATSVGDRYLAELGPGIKPRFKYHQMKFGEAIEHIAKELEISSNDKQLIW